MTKPLVIVESPAKAKTIARFLGKDWVVEASIGHVRDLPSSAAEIAPALKKEPWARLGVDVERGYAPLYVVPADKKAKIRELKQKLKGASALYLATDEDREGEAISWHLRELLEPKVPVKRMVFHEITKAAIAEAVEKCRDIDASLVDAQEARRILDRLYGYEVSPILWRKIAPRLSAGRVQSAATRLIVERERERMAFCSAAWWDADVTLEREAIAFPAQVATLDGRALAQGRDFGADGALLPGRDVLRLDEAGARSLAAALAGALPRVSKVEPREFSSSPKAPFTTSTLQQEAGRKLGMTAKRAMQAAQRLYEGGFITYMRTDSVALSSQALAAARTLVSARYGADYLPRAPRVWEGKARNAQEAHEAIRPAGESFRPPEEVAREVGGDEARLYELVWKRTVASQMVDAKLRSVTSTFAVALRDGRRAELVARGRTVLFDGYLRAYVEGSDEAEPGRDHDEAALPLLQQGDEALVVRAEPAGHATKPPARYTEAGLVQKLEELGIGRPSTYASIIATILEREYATKRGAALVPRPLAFAVVQLLVALEPALVDYSFTADMEDKLDAIARGEEKRNDFLERFYRGRSPGLQAIVTERATAIDPRAVCTIPLGEHEGQPLALRVGRYGPYLEHAGRRANVPEELALDELTVEKALELLAAASKAEEPIGRSEEGLPVYVRVGRFGPYVQLGDDPEEGEERRPKRASLLRSMDPRTLTLEQALALLSLPRELGLDADGQPIRAALGRFGPYLAKEVAGSEKPEYRNLQREEQLFTVTLEEARALFAQPRQVRRGRGAAAPPLRELGPDPASGATIVVREGRYGPYCSDGTTHASLPKGTSVEELTAEEAARLLADRRASAPAGRKGGKGGRKKAARKAPARGTKRKAARTRR